MLSKRKLLALMVMSFFVFLSACSDESTKVEETDEMEEVTDEDLIAVVETNVEKLMAKDFDGYMETIHRDSPVYDVTSETITELLDYTLDIELSNLSVEEKSAEEATVLYTQRTIAEEAQDYQNNETVGKHILKPEDGSWKIYNSEQTKVTVLENEAEEPVAEAITMEGDYAEILSSLENPFGNEDWVLVNYREGDGEATAEYITPEENLGNYSEMVTIEYYKDGNELSGLANFVSILMKSLEEMATGELIFNYLSETESEVIYEFSLSGDDTQINQEEIARVFVRDSDLYLVRYTVMDGKIDDTETWIERLREVE